MQNSCHRETYRVAGTSQTQKAAGQIWVRQRWEGVGLCQNKSLICVEAHADRKIQSPQSPWSKRCRHVCIKRLHGLLEAQILPWVLMAVNHERNPSHWFTPAKKKVSIIPHCFFFFNTGSLDDFFPEIPLSLLPSHTSKT